MASFFINRPIVAMVIAILTVLGGLIALRGLPLAQFPDIVPPQIIVDTTYTGADAVTIEQSVAAPLEQQMNGVDNMLYMQSTNANDGTEELTVTFGVETNVSIDQVNVQNRVAQAQPNLPADVNQYGLTTRKSTGLPMLVISLFSPHNTYDSLFLANYATINVNDVLYRVPGVGEVRLFGASDYAMRIWVKPDVLAKLGLAVPDLANAVTLDTTLPVTEGIREIVQTLIEAMFLVILVVFLFLQNWRATLIPMIAVPVSLIGTFAVFPLLGFSINTLSLFAFVLAIGLVVDDAIVVVEAVEHHIEEGMSPRDATMQAMKEVSGPVISIALILASVFIPVAFVSGVQGRLNKQFAVTIAVSVMISAFNALTLSPALSAMLLRPRKG